LLVLAARALAERGDAPGRHRMAPALRLALAAAVRVVDRVHRRAAHGRPLAAPAAPARLAARDVLVVDVADLPNGGAARERHPALVPAARATPGDAAVHVPPATLLQWLGEALLGLGLRDLLERGDRHEAPARAGRFVSTNSHLHLRSFEDLDRLASLDLDDCLLPAGLAAFDQAAALRLRAHLDHVHALDVDVE